MTMDATQKAPLTSFGSVRARFYELDESRELAEKLAFWAGRLAENQLEPALVWNAFDLASLQDGLSQEEQGCVVLLVLVLRMQQEYGSTCVPMTGAFLAWNLARILRAGEDCEVVAGEILVLLQASRLSALVGAPGDYKPLILEETPEGEKYLYIEQVHRAEGALIARLRAFCQSSQSATDPGVIERYIETIRASSTNEIGERQLHALRTCLDHPLVLISGGPGTGKTTLVFSVLRMLVQGGVLPEDIALAAPTGKAANRMGESLKNSLGGLRNDVAEEKKADAKALAPIFESAQTIHRLLGYSPGRDRFMRDESSPIEARVVIIDEASMLDLTLMLAVLRALQPGTRLILLGDKDQLPSVDAGAVFRDLILLAGTAREGVSATSLDKNFRAESSREGEQILALAKAINQGQVGALAVQNDPGKLAFHGTERIDFASAEKVEKDVAGKVHARLVDGFLNVWFARHYQLRRLPEGVFLNSGGQPVGEDAEKIREVFAQYGRARMLCLTTKRATGTEALNRKMHAFFRAKFGHLGGGAFLPGEPVMMLKNDYALQVFNGDQGIIVSVQNAKARTSRYVVFQTADAEVFRIIPLAQIAANIELSYAMTVHKSQGSEYAHIAMMLPTEEIPLLTREILYTGVTRASKSVTVVGTFEILAAGAEKQTARTTGLRRW